MMVAETEQVGRPCDCELREVESGKWSFRNARQTSVQQLDFGAAGRCSNDIHLDGPVYENVSKKVNIWWR